MSAWPLPENVRRFLAFRVLFNARFYYPVLAVLFVDLGLSLDRYALLNVAWAASIVAFELPLGALGDRIGRKPLVVGAAILMVVEMAVLAFAPTGHPTLLFAVFLVNRVLSGAAEAAASGADEALAYDTLVEEGRREEWPRVLTRLQFIMSTGFFVSMIAGAAVYDPELMSAVTGLQLDQATTARFPVYLTLLLSFGAVLAAAGMREPRMEKEAAPASGWRTILEAGHWIRTTAFALALICLSLILDSIVRLFLTLSSSYYRLVEIPEAAFGLLGAAFSGLGFLSPPLANALIHRRSPLFNYVVVASLMLAGLLGVAAFRSPAGALFVVFMAVGFHLLGFLTSHYLNAVTDSGRRATVLSFRSLAGNLAYGGIGVLYALLFRSLSGREKPPAGSTMEELVLGRTLWWIPIAFAAAVIPLLFWAGRIKTMRQTPPAA
jgi:MFS family permease